MATVEQGLRAINPYRWVKGQSGNPKGTSRNPNLLAQLKRKLLAEADKRFSKTGEATSGLLIRDQLIEKLLNLALNSTDDRVCFAATKEIFDRCEGKPQQPVSITQPDNLRTKYLTCAQYLRDACIQSGHEIDERLIIEGVNRVYPGADVVLTSLDGEASEG